MSYPSGRMFEEVAYIAYHFHWAHGEIMELAHVDRRRWVDEIIKINRRVNENREPEGPKSWP